MKISRIILCFLVISLPVQNVILKQEEKKIIAKVSDKGIVERNLGSFSSDFACLFLVFIFAYMLFNAPVWAMALITAPFIFASANTMFSSGSRKLLSAGKTYKKVKRLLRA